MKALLISVVLLKLFFISQETTAQQWMTMKQVNHLPILWQDSGKSIHYNISLGIETVHETQIFRSFTIHDWSDEGRLLYHWFTGKGVTVNSSLKPHWMAVQVHKAYTKKLLRSNAGTSSNERRE